MIRPPGWNGVAFSERSDGDIRSEISARVDMARRLGVEDEWAEVAQIHGNDVVRVASPGYAGAGDALWTSEIGLPLAVFTADCFGVVLTADTAVGVAHAGWRGLVSGVVNRLRDVMTAAGHAPVRAGIGPGIGPCCFEVGPEVAEEFDGDVAETRWGTLSVDLPSAVVGQLQGLEIWNSGACTRHEDGWFSHRADATPKRLATIGWLG